MSGRSGCANSVTTLLVGLALVIMLLAVAVIWLVQRLGLG
jgi:flagellar biogenesis protein FliO